MDVLGGLFSSGLAAYLVYGDEMNTSSDTGFSLNMAGKCCSYSSLYNYVLEFDLIHGSCFQFNDLVVGEGIERF